MPLLGVILLLDCCSLMVTVPLDGLVQVMVTGLPAVTTRVLWPAGMLIALFCASAKEAKRARAGAQKRIVTGHCEYLEI